MSDPCGYLGKPSIQADLKRTAVRGGTITLLGQATKAILSAGSMVVLARLLTPADFGLVAMVAALTGFIAIFKDLGLSMATIQRAEIRHEQISTLFWINVWASLGLVVITAALAPVVAWFYHDPRLTSVTAVIAGVFLFAGLTAQHQALLRRQMRFGALAGIEISALTAGILAAVGLAIVLPERAGYWALIGRQIIVAAVTAAGVWLMCKWRPGRPVRRSGSKSMLMFGGYLTGFGVVNYAVRNLDNVLIGWRWHERQLGLYSKAYQLLLLPIQQINAPIASVAIPTLSRLQQDPARYRRYYCNAMNLLAYASTPISVGMLALAEEVVAIMLGPQWEGAGRIFQVLAISAIGQPIGNANGWIYISRDRTRRMFRWGMISAPIFVVGFVIGLPHGPIGVAAAFAICELGLRVPAWLFAFRGTPISISDLVSAIHRPIVLSLAMLAVMLLMRQVLAGSPLWPRFGITLAAGLITFGAAMWLWPAARGEGRKLWETAQLLRSPDRDHAAGEQVIRSGDKRDDWI